VKSGFWIFIASLIALGGSWCGFVLGTERQLGDIKQATVLNSTETYPLQRPGDATLGLQVYRANGCAACHTEQVRQTGVVFEVAPANSGRNSAALTSLLASLVLTNLDKDQADAAAGEIKAAGGRAEIRVVATGPDIARGWGTRQSVAEDYLYDQPVQPGSLRAGPDLANIGMRDPDLNWQLTHLYAPAAVVKGSSMPPFRYLFELRKIGDAPSPDALRFPGDFVLPAGYEVVPRPEAKELAAYLLSLRANVPLYNAPVSQ